MAAYNTVEEVVKKLAGVENPAFLSDLDGTLLNIAENPKDVVIPRDLSEIFMGLSRIFDGAVGIITGRDMAFVDQVFPQRPPASSGHGMVIRHDWKGDDKQQVMSPDVTLLEGILRASFNAYGLVDSGCGIETKQHSCALHWRTSNKASAEGDISQIAQMALSLYDMQKKEGFPSLALTRGEKVIEIGPAGIDKGTALDCLRESQVFAGKTVIYCGDTHADEEAIRVLRPGDIAIGIGPTLAGKTNLLLPDPVRLHEVMRRLPQARL